MAFQVTVGKAVGVGKREGVKKTGLPETPTASTNKQATTANGGNSNAAQSNKGINNPQVKAAANLGNKIHYDQLNGGPAGSAALPSELQALYPNTQFLFTPRGAKGADVTVVGGTHPSQYPNSTWQPNNMYSDFKPGTVSGSSTFKRDIKKENFLQTQSY